MFFSVRLFSNRKFHQRHKNNSKNGQLCTKITKILYETGKTKSKETIRYKLSLYSIGKKISPVFTENERMFV